MLRYEESKMIALIRISTSPFSFLMKHGINIHNYEKTKIFYYVINSKIKDK